MTETTGIVIHPATADRWDDLELLFGANGACAGCWCMYWRLKRSDYAAGCGEANKAALRAMTLSGRIPGLIAYHNGRPVGWCSVAPREEFPVLDRSPVLKRVDDRPVWSIVCYFIAKDHRKRGLTEVLTRAAIDHVREHGGTIVEAYPALPKEGPQADVWLFTGPMGVFGRLGFVEAARRGAKAIMRYHTAKDE